MAKKYVVCYGRLEVQSAADSGLLRLNYSGSTVPRYGRPNRSTAEVLEVYERAVAGVSAYHPNDFVVLVDDDEE